MKKTTMILYIAALIVIAILVTGCPKEVESVSVTERMTMFREDANAGNFGNLKGHTHPDATAYNTTPPEWWPDTLFASSYELPLGAPSIIGTTATITGADGEPFTFYLKEDEKDVYKIYKITNLGGTKFQ